MEMNNYLNEVNLLNIVPILSENSKRNLVNMKINE